MYDFEEELAPHCLRVLSLSLFVNNKDNKEYVLNRRFLGKYNLEVTWMEETLDAAGARKSEKWFPVREGISTIKMLTSVIYDVLHVENSIPFYNLLKIDKDFGKEVHSVLDSLYKSLCKTSCYIIKSGKECGLSAKDTNLSVDDFRDINHFTGFDKDRTLRHIENPGKTLIYLGTEFLSLKDEMTLLNKVSSIKLKSYKEYIPGYISEDKIRLVLVRFHNLQSLYDTYLSESDIEDVDPRLKILRGHISVIYHLIKSATKFIHYYERHIIPYEKASFYKKLQPMEAKRFIEILVNFFISYSVDYFNAAKKICNKVIDNYAEIEERYIPIPPYRGFHVRPSTLVSKIVNYYGGKVNVEFNDSFYDPSVTLELFRLNEEINAQKRLKLFNLIIGQEVEGKTLDVILRDLEKRGEVIVYNKKWDEIEIKSEESFIEYVKRAFTLLLASGNIDIKMDLNIKYIGDKRSLDDIELLAKHRYGEDLYGNNIPLPKNLSYLKR